MKKILMVCLGNICRSPLAHGILTSKLPQNKFYVDSAGTASYHIGSAPDSRSIKVAKHHNIDISKQTARQFSVNDFDNFNHIFAMDTSNYNTIISLARNSVDISKVKLFLDENPLIKNKNMPDPYYGDITDFEYVFKIANQTCDFISEKLLQN